jgi:hypothetical protein
MWVLAQQRNEVWQRVVILLDLFREGELFVRFPSRPWLSCVAHFAGLP